MSSKRMQDINDELSPLIRDMKRGRIVDIDEDTFKSKLLPLAVARYSNVDHKIELTHWQATTGESPYHGVRVIRAGRPLYTTPPLILSPKITFEGGSLLDNLKDSEQSERAGLPPKDIMDESTLKPNLSIDSLSQALTTWVYIFKLYGIKLIPINADGSESPTFANAAVPSPTPSSDAEWEDDDDDDLL